jgi:maltooligosyltrehalose trehalohydrolase
MGEEYGETAAFPYFISHSEPDLVEAVRRGRQAEFAAFQQDGTPPDPQDEATFAGARLDHELRRREPHRTIRELYRELIRARQSVPALANLAKEDLEVLGYEKPPVLFLRRWRDQDQVAAVFNFSPGPAATLVPLPPGKWHRLVDSAAERWRGPGSQTPPELTSAGTVTFNLAAQSFILLESYNLASYNPGNQSATPQK